MRRQRRPDRPATAEAVHRRAVRYRLGFGDDGAFARVGRQFLDLQFQLVEQLAAAFGRLPEAVALHLGNQQL
jgi:hypothetical protein